MFFSNHGKSGADKRKNCDVENALDGQQTPYSTSK